MNAKNVEKLMTCIEEIKKQRVEIQSILSAEEDSFDNMADQFKNNKSGQDAEKDIDDLAESVDLISDAIEILEDLCL